MHVVYPCQSHCPTIPFIQAVEGTPLLPAPGGFAGNAHAAQASSSSQGRGRGGGQASGNNRNRRKNNPSGSQPVQQHNWPKPWGKKPWKEHKGQGKDGKPKGEGKGQGKDGKPKGGKGDGKPYIQK